MRRLGLFIISVLVAFFLLASNLCAETYITTWDVSGISLDIADLTELVLDIEIDRPDQLSFPTTGFAKLVTGGTYAFVAVYGTGILRTYDGLIFFTLTIQGRYLVFNAFDNVIILRPSDYSGNLSSGSITLRSVK